MADVLIEFNEAAYLADKATYNRIGAVIQDIVDSYNALGFGDLVAAELVTLFSTPIDFIFDKMTGGEPVSIAGIEVDKEKAIDILKKPAGYAELIAAIQQVAVTGIKDDQASITRSVNKATIGSIYTIDVSGQVVLISAFDTKLQEQNKLYAKTDRAKAMLSFAQNFLQKADEFGVTNIFKVNPAGIGQTVNYLIKGGPNSPVSGGSDPNLSVNAKFVVRFNDDTFNGRP